MLAYKESPHLGECGQQEDEDLKTFDLSEPDNWPVTEKLTTDQQRSFLSSQAVLLARKLGP